MKNKVQTIFITGASSGIGKEIAKTLAEKGHKVFAGVRRKVDKTELEALNKNIIAVYIDVVNSSSIDKAFWYVLKNTDKIDVLINNAGIATAGPFEAIEVSKIKEQFDVNTFAPISVVQKFLPLLHGGKIINMSSMAASGIFPYISPYCASKRALDIMFNCFALENKDSVKVISVKPAVIKTPIWNKSVKKAREMFEKQNEVIREKYLKDLLILEKNALENNKTGIDVKKVAEVIVKIVNASNPKPSYCIGFKSNLACFIGALPVSIVNFIIKMKLKHI